MIQQRKVTSIVNTVLHCAYCRPLSGCILSDLKDKKKQEIVSHLNGLNENAFNRIISYHDCCPYKDRENYFRRD